MTDRHGSRRPISSTYRLQLTPEFGFDAARSLVGYLADLGVSHLYLSPILTARPGSTHGYDVVDPSTVSEALGGEQRLRELADTAHQAGLGLVVDIVPNHLGVSPANKDWRYLLAEGQSGEGGRVFDVDWHPRLPGAEGKVVLPVLGDQYGTVLANGELRVVEEPDDEGRRFHVRYHDHAFPLSPESLEALDRVGRIDTLTGEVGKPQTWGRLHSLLERQHYRLVDWRIGDRVVNYRRFFAITDLAGVRQEDGHVFERTHAKIFELVDDGVIDGLRVDHPDGLRDPARYLERLERRTRGIWTVVEKILHPGEPLEPWATAGTTGYEFCNDVAGLFVDPAAEQELDALARELGADDRPYAEQVAAAKHEVLRNDLSSEFTRLVLALWALAQEHLEVRDIEDRHCEAALAATLVGMPVYRCYVDSETGDASERDRKTVMQATGYARATGLAPAHVVDLLEAVLTGGADPSPAHLEFTARFQQLSGALMAKGVEDTVFYRYNRMVALNEVGGDPSRFGVTPTDFHDRNAARAAGHPEAMLTTATHDTKRGEDVRLRIAALTEMPQRWAAVAKAVAAAAPIDGPTALLLLQTMVGTWPGPESGEKTPALRDRLVDYARKAAREAGLFTNWYEPDDVYEQRLAQFVDSVLGNDEIRRQLAAVAEPAAEIGMVSGLAQVVLRTLSPGVPDIYQGNELWDDSLVDPDNRRPVDYDGRRRMLEAAATAPAAALWGDRHDGRVKLAVLRACLAVRADHRTAFNATSGYRPLAASGVHADHIVAFARSDREAPRVIAVVPRLPAAVMGDECAAPVGDRWGDTTLTLPGGTWRRALSDGDALSGEVPLGEVLDQLPVAVLVAAPGE